MKEKRRNMRRMKGAFRGGEERGMRRKRRYYKVLSSFHGTLVSIGKTSRGRYLLRHYDEAAGLGGVKEEDKHLKNKIENERR